MRERERGRMYVMLTLAGALQGISLMGYPAIRAILADLVTAKDTGTLLCVQFPFILVLLPITYRHSVQCDRVHTDTIRSAVYCGTE